MNRESSHTEAVLRRHLQAFLEQRGVDAILADCADDACLIAKRNRTAEGSRSATSSTRSSADFRPRPSASSPCGACAYRDDVAYITWSAGRELPLGIDTFVVRDGRIVLQTFAMYGTTLKRRASQEPGISSGPRATPRWSGRAIH